MRVIAFFALVLSGVNAQPTQSCATNNTPCPPPTWVPQWNLSMSTICQPSSPGYFVVPQDKPYGLVSLDWSVARDIWNKNGVGNATIEATSVEGCRQIKAVSPNTKCFIYHNMELALQSLESQRAVMYDPTKAHYFLQYLDSSGNRNGTIYNERQEPGDQVSTTYTYTLSLPLPLPLPLSLSLSLSQHTHNAHNNLQPPLQ